MEISDSTRCIFYMAKLFGLAPYSVTKDHREKVQIKRSIIFMVWSIFLATTLVCLTYRGIFYDANSNSPARMKSGTSKVVTGLDVSVVIFVSLSGVICGLISLRSTQEFNRRMHKADEVLAYYTNEKKDQIRAYVLMISVLSIIIIMIGLDIGTWTKLEDDERERARNSSNKSDVMVPQEAKNVHWYLPFYFTYIMLTGIHIQFAQTAVGIGRRYRRLNLMLKMNFLKTDQKLTGKIVPIHVSNSISQTLEAISVNPLKKSSTLKDISLINAKQIAIIDRLAYTHDSLGKAMKNVTEAFGLTVLVILTSCLLHLVATAYFLLLEFLSHKDVSVFAWLQILWILFHIMRLLLIVEPCHVTSTEAGQTIGIICDIERNSTNIDLKKKLKNFWRQLLCDNHEFSALGMCIINRGILTSFSSAIATYLVILIQFQSTDG